MKKIGKVMLILGIFLIVAGGVLSFFQEDRGKKTAVILFKDETGKILYQKTVKIGEAVEKIVPDEREGFAFLDWYYDSSIYDFHSKVLKDMVLIGKWEEKLVQGSGFQVTFYNDDDTLYESQNVEKENLAKEPAVPTSDRGGTFIGWYNGEEKFDFQTPIVENMILKARYSVDVAVSTTPPEEVMETDIQVDFSELVMRVHEEKSVVTSVVPANATNSEIRISCEDTSLCSIHENNIISALKAGQTNLILESAHGIKKTIPVIIKPNYEVKIENGMLRIISSDSEYVEGVITATVKATGETKTITVSITGIPIEDGLEIVSVQVQE